MTNDISVCMCTYNGEKYIERQLRSIVSQAMQPNEVIIVDDSSSDRTVQIIEKFSSRYNYIKLYINSSNMGVNHSFLKSIRKSSNGIVVFSDQDDFWYKDRLAVIDQIFKGDCNVSMVVTNAHIYNNEKYTGLTTFDIHKPTRSFLKVFYKNRFIGCQIAIRKAKISENITIPKYTYYDHLIALLLLQSEGVSFINRPLSKYARHENTVTELGVPNSYLESVSSRYFIFLFFVKRMLNKKVSDSLKEGVKSLARSIESRGVIKTAVFIGGELLFDAKFGVDTRSMVSSTSVINQGMSDVARPYQGTNFYIIRFIFRELKKVVDLEKSHMLDYGSGMGRVILSGLYYGVAQVEGVEFDRDLYNKCNENIDKFCKERKVSRNRAKCILADAQLYEIPKGVNIFFLYNPFSSPVIERVVERIFSFAKTQEDEIIVAYVNPIFRELFLSKGFVIFSKGDGEFDLYKYSP